MNRPQKKDPARRSAADDAATAARQSGPSDAEAPAAANAPGDGSSSERDLIPARPEEAGSGLLVRAPLETIAHAMKAQVELLRQLQERQRTIEDAVRDEKRHELVVNSAQSLNEAFRGMQQSQDRLAEKLADGGGAGRALRVWIAVGGLCLLLAGIAAAYVLRRGAEGLDAMAEKLAAPKADDAARAALSDLSERVKSVEASERAAFQTELERLRAAVDGAAVERESLRKERDAAREELGQVRAKSQDAEKSVVELRTKLEGSDKEIARLTTQTIGDQRLIAQMNNTLETLRTRAAAPSPAPAPGPETPAASVADDAAARARAVEAGRSGANPGTDGAASRPATGEAARTESADEDPRDLPFSPGQRDDLNSLLAKHRGSPRYSVASATKIFDRKLKQVVLEVRGVDGSLDKTIEAESMTVKISPRGEMVDLDFEKGYVVFHGQAQGRDAKSPFFNDRYQIVLLGAPSKDWLTAGLAFVAMR